MQNPKEFKATPYEHKAPVAHSGPEPKKGRAEKAHSMTATPFNHFKPTKKSGGEGIGDLSKHFKKSETKSSPVGAGMPSAISHSGGASMMSKEPKKYKHNGKDDGSRG